MEPMQIDQLMNQMRATAARIDATRPGAETAVESANPGAFKAALDQAVSTVSDTQKAAAAGAAAVERGDPNVPLTDVMLQLQKADLSFRAMTEVRNKLVNAYQEIMNMPV
ncbi:MAG: flagellar hook-basal body complex protein FliE [Gammaproteobacteria bacterium]